MVNKIIEGVILIQSWSSAFLLPSDLWLKLILHIIFFTCLILLPFNFYLFHKYYPPYPLLLYYSCICFSYFTITAFLSWMDTLNAGCFQIINLRMSFFLFISVQCSNFLISQILFINSFFSVFSIAMEDCTQSITAHRLFLIVRLFLKDLIANDVLRHIFSNRKKKKKKSRGRSCC